LMRLGFYLMRSSALPRVRQRDGECKSKSERGLKESCGQEGTRGKK
jgi:hypothetical protein